MVALAHNVPTLGEGGDFNHKRLCGERMLNLAVNIERSTAPTLLPNVCEAMFLTNFKQLNKIKWKQQSR